MAASGEHVKALVRSHANGDDAAFYSVAMQVAAQAARQGHNRLASDIKHVIDEARQEPVVRNVTSIAKPRGDLAELVHATIPDVSLKQLIGPPELIHQISSLITEQLQREKLQAHGFHPAHRILLEGPPGTGKTLTASVIAHEMGLPLLTVRLDSLFSRFMGETAGKLRTVFDAVGTQRAVYLFDEFDAVGADRTGNDVGEARRVLNSFLVFLEAASSESIVIAATNHRGALDPALFRRFDQVISYDLPDITQASKILRSRLGALGRGIRWQSVAARAQGLSHAELVKAAESAAKRTLLNGRASVSTQELTDAVALRQLASHG